MSQEDHSRQHSEKQAGVPPSALDLIKSNIDFVQDQYREDYEKEEFIGYEEALYFIDQFVNAPNPSLADCHQQEDKNFPLIITGDEGCGKTHTIIQWLS